MNILDINVEARLITVQAKPHCQTKGLRYALQKKFHKMNMFGLEFWFEHESDDGIYYFMVLSNHDRDYIDWLLSTFKKGRRLPSIRDLI